MRLTLSQIDILINPKISDEKEQLINSICLEIHKDPFCILDFPYEIVTLNRVLFDLIYKREQKELYLKEFAEEKQLEIVQTHPILFLYISNVYSKSLFQYILKSENNYKLNQQHKKLLQSLSDKEKKILIQVKPSLISLFSDNQELREIGFLSNCAETIMFLPFLTEQDQLFIARYGYIPVSYNEFDLLLDKSQNKTIHPEALKLMIQKNPKYYVQATSLVPDVNHCISILNNHPSLFVYLDLVHGNNYEEVMSALIEKKKIIDGMS